MSTLTHYPTPISGLTLGMMGIAGFWYEVSSSHATGFIVMAFITLLATALLLPLLLKFLLHPAELYVDLRHPTVGSVVPTMAMTCMLLSHSLQCINITAASMLWLLAIMMHVIFFHYIFHAPLSRCGSQSNGTELVCPTYWYRRCLFNCTKY